MKDEQVRIELPKVNMTESIGPPVKYKKEVRLGKFSFVPKIMPKLKDQVDAVTWKSTEKTLELVIRETPEFDVYKWVQYIQKRYAEAIKGPFVDLDEDAIHLSFLGDEEVIAKLVFKNLCVKHHELTLLTQSLSPGIYYSLLLSYSECNFIEIEPEEEVSTNELVDQEWQTVTD